MPVTEQEIRRLGDYVGATPAPADFDAFWSKRMAEADQVPLDFAVTPSEIPPFHTCEYLDLWFRGMGGAQLYPQFFRIIAKQIIVDLFGDLLHPRAALQLPNRKVEEIQIPSVD